MSSTAYTSALSAANRAVSADPDSAASPPEEIIQLLPTCVRRRGFISPSQPEFKAAEYSVRIALRSSSAKVIALVPIGGPHLTTRFEKRVKGGLVVESLVEVSCLNEGGNTLEGVVERGFSLSNGGIFSTGEIGLRNVDVGGSAKFEFILSRVHVGRSYPIEDHLLRADTRPPEGYDSVYIFQPSEDEESLDIEGTGDRANNAELPSFVSPYPGEGLTYFHKYAVFDDAQVLPMYYVLFEYDPFADDLKKVEDELNLAHGMYETLKREDRLEDAMALREDIRTLEDLMAQARQGLARGEDAVSLLRDTREAVSHVQHALTTKIGSERKLPRFWGYCHYHPSMPLEFWDPIWGTAICVYCKMVGSHATGEAALHKLIPIGQAYENAMTASKKDDPAVEGKRQNILQHLNKIDERLEQIHKNSAEVQEQLYQIFQDAMMQLQEKTRSKLRILLGEEAELRRQLSQLNWMDDFVDYERDMLPPLDFLNEWTNFSNSRAELLQRPTVTRPLDVQSNLRCSGKLTIFDDSPGSSVGDARNRSADVALSPSRTMSGNPSGGFGSNVPRSPFGYGSSDVSMSQALTSGFGSGGPSNSAYGGGLGSYGNGNLNTPTTAGVGYEQRVSADELWRDGLAQSGVNATSGGGGLGMGMNYSNSSSRY